MTDTKIRITVEGNSATGSKDVSMSDFVKIIDNVRKLLAYAATVALGKEHKCDFVISDLSHDSPACVEITPQSSHANSGQLIAEMLEAQNKSLLSDNKTDNKNLSDKYLSSVLKLGKKSGIRIKMDAVSADLNSPVPIMETGQPMVDAIEKIKIKETVCKTSINGRLEKLNLHGDNYIYVYPRISQWNRVKVLFQDSHKEQIIKCVDKIVKVSGIGRYRPRLVRPYEMKMESIKQLPKSTMKISDFKGKFPNITGGKSVDEYMRELREEKDEIA